RLEPAVGETLNDVELPVQSHADRFLHRYREWLRWLPFAPHPCGLAALCRIDATRYALAPARLRRLLAVCRRGRNRGRRGKQPRRQSQLPIHCLPPFDHRSVTERGQLSFGSDMTCGTSFSQVAISRLISAARCSGVSLVTTAASTLAISCL